MRVLLDILAVIILWRAASQLFWQLTLRNFGLKPTMRRDLQASHWRWVESIAQHLQANNLTLDEFARSRGIKPHQLRRAMARPPKLWQEPGPDEVMRSMVGTLDQTVHFMAGFERHGG